MRHSLIIVLCLFSFTALIQGQDNSYNPNMDTNYKQLKAKDLNELSEREFNYLMLKEKECIDFNQILYKSSMPNNFELNISDKIDSYAKEQVKIEKSHLNWYKINTIFSIGTALTTTVLIVFNIIN